MHQFLTLLAALLVLTTVLAVPPRRNDANEINNNDDDNTDRISTLPEAALLRVYNNLPLNDKRDMIMLSRSFHRALHAEIPRLFGEKFGIRVIKELIKRQKYDIRFVRGALQALNPDMLQYLTRQAAFDGDYDALELIINSGVANNSLLIHPFKYFWLINDEVMIGKLSKFFPSNLAAAYSQDAKEFQVDPEQIRLTEEVEENLCNRGNVSKSVLLPLFERGFCLSPTAISGLVASGQIESVPLLYIYAATDVDEILFSAVLYNRLDIAKLALEHYGADANYVGSKMFFNAAATGSVLLVKLLVDHGADVDNYGWRALGPVVDGSHLGVAQLLLNDYKVAITDLAGLLEMCIRRRFPEMCELLLTGSLAETIFNFAASTAILNFVVDAVIQDDLESLQIFFQLRNLDWKAYLGHALTAAVDAGKLDALRSILSAARPIEQSYLDKTFLQSVNRNRPEMSKLLLEKGADVNAANGLALFEAQRQGRERLAEILRSHGAKTMM